MNEDLEEKLRVLNEALDAANEGFTIIEREVHLLRKAHLTLHGIVEGMVRELHKIQDMVTTKH
jgi:hypothetical protein